MDTYIVILYYIVSRYVKSRNLQSLICLIHEGLDSRFLDTWDSLSCWKKLSHVEILLYCWHQYHTCLFTYHCYDVNKKGSHGSPGNILVRKNKHDSWKQILCIKEMKTKIDIHESINCTWQEKNTNVSNIASPNLIMSNNHTYLIIHMSTNILCLTRKKKHYI